MSYFPSVEPIRFAGPASQSELAFRHYNADQLVLGKPMRAHLRMAACYWHSLVWPGSDVFGAGTLPRPWLNGEDAIQIARQKADAAFEFFSKLGIDYYCFHDTDVAPEGDSLAQYRYHFAMMLEVLQRKQQETGLRLLWGTANCFSHPRYAAGAATNPDPEIFAYAATQVVTAMDATRELGGENYVLWGGREGYDSLLNTDLKRERQQLGRFMSMVVEHKLRTGFTGSILIEPKPQEPAKHQYDYDTATVYGFLTEFGLEREIKVNIEANHATLAGHSFHHEVASAVALGILGGIDANRGDPQNGWDTDQFPNSVEELTLVLYEVIKGGGLGSGGFNFDAKLRRQSIHEQDLFHAHIGAMDVLALALKRAARILENDWPERFRQQRYAGWDQAFGQQILNGQFSLAELASHCFTHQINPRPVSGAQERLENWLTQQIHG